MNVSRFMNLAAIFSLDLESQFRETRAGTLPAGGEGGGAPWPPAPERYGG